MDLLLKGVATGLLLSIMVGPVFFVLLETSIRKGVKAALAVDLGVLISDIVYIVIAFVFFTQVAELAEGNDNSILRLVGGSLFLVYGVYTFFKKVKKSESTKEFEVVPNAAGYIILALKGFLLNMMNPLVVFYWFSVMTLGAGDGDEHGSSMILYLTYILVTFFSIDFLKIIGAKRLRSLVTPRLLMGLNRMVGIVFVGFGLVLVTQGIIGLVTK
ncbi:MAG: LysE family translocator [bacterium]|nr:LysE family translocator [bacterium]